MSDGERFSFQKQWDRNRGSPCHTTVCVQQDGIDSTQGNRTCNGHASRCSALAGAFGSLLTSRTAEWFIAFSMVMLAVEKLQDVHGVSTMFPKCDLLARRWVRYGSVYAFAEAFAGILRVSGVLTIISAPVALFIGTIGAF